MTIYKIPVSTIDGKQSTLETYSGKVLLFVNTASECGFTPQYADLEKLHETYREKGLVVLGFPSNDFGAQEPGTNQEIKKFCDLKFKVKFPLFAKGPVKGPSKQPIYQALIDQAPTHEEVAWNFEKFLVDRNGKVVGRFKSKVTPMGEVITQAIETALNVY